jgi:hypothetical protein
MRRTFTWIRKYWIITIGLPVLMAASLLLAYASDDSSSPTTTEQEPTSTTTVAKNVDLQAPCPQQPTARDHYGQTNLVRDEDPSLSEMPPWLDDAVGSFNGTLKAMCRYAQDNLSIAVSAVDYGNHNDTMWIRGRDRDAGCNDGCGDDTATDPNGQDDEFAYLFRQGGYQVRDVTYEPVDGKSLGVLYHVVMVGQGRICTVDVEVNNEVHLDSVSAYNEANRWLVKEVCDAV